MNHTRILFPTLLLAVALSAPANAVILEVGTTRAEPGGAAEIVVDIDSADTPVGALVFSVGFDRQKLRFDGSAKSGDQLSNVSVVAPPGYVASSTVLPHSGGDAIAVSIVRSGVAPPLRSGQVRLKFETWPDAEGTAWVGVLGNASAASTLGQLATVETIDGAVAIEAPAGELVVAPASIKFDSAPSSASVRLMNRGRNSVTVAAVDLQGSGFGIDPLSLPLVIAPGSEVALTVHASGVAASHGTISVTTSGPEARSSQVVLELVDPLDPEHEEVHEWLIPGGEGASILLHDPRQPSSVSIKSTATAGEMILELPVHETREMPGSGEPWYLLRSNVPSVRAALLDATGRHLLDAVRLDALPRGTASLSAADLSGASLTVLNLDAQAATVTIELRSLDGELIEREVMSLRARQHTVLDLSDRARPEPLIIVLHHSRATSSLAAWLTGRSPSGKTLRLAR